MEFYLDEVLCDWDMGPLFVNIFSEHMELFQDTLEEDVYLDILSTNFSSKEEKNELPRIPYNEEEPSALYVGEPDEEGWVQC